MMSACSVVIIPRNVYACSVVGIPRNVYACSVVGIPRNDACMVWSNHVLEWVYLERLDGYMSCSTRSVGLVSIYLQAF